MRHRTCTFLLVVTALVACRDLSNPYAGCGDFCGGDPPPPPPPASCAADDTTTVVLAEGWPNLPAGFSTVSSEGFTLPTENGWVTLQRDTSHGSGATLAVDMGAPVSPPSVLQYTFGTGFLGGHTPGVTYYDLTVPVRETYFGFWWKMSNPWQNNAGSGVNKLAFMLTRQTATDGQIVIILFSTGGPYTVQVVPEFAPSGDIRRLPPNVTATPVTLGDWHRLEWYVKYSSTPATPDGETRWWLDGILQGSYGDLKTPADSGFSEYQLAPTWGGSDGTKNERDFVCYDHAFISNP
jgi:hypothetical protein